MKLRHLGLAGMVAEEASDATIAGGGPGGLGNGPGGPITLRGDGEAGSGTALLH